jgi:hypothetical protein
VIQVRLENRFVVGERGPALPQLGTALRWGRFGFKKCLGVEEIRVFQSAEEHSDESLEPSIPLLRAAGSEQIRRPFDRNAGANDPLYGHCEGFAITDLFRSLRQSAVEACLVGKSGVVSGDRELKGQTERSEPFSGV